MITNQVFHRFFWGTLLDLWMTAKSVDDMEPGEGWSSASAAVAGSSRREVHQDLHRVGQPTQALVLGDQLGGTDGFLGEERKRVRDCISVSFNLSLCIRAVQHAVMGTQDVRY